MTTTDSENKTGKTPLTLSKPGKLELKKTVETGRVRQSFSHGRSKTVTVEVRKKRTFKKGAAGALREVKKDDKKEISLESAEIENKNLESIGDGTLTSKEKTHRLKALQEANKAEEKTKQKAKEDALKAKEEAEQKAKEDDLKAKEEAKQKAKKDESKKESSKKEIAENAIEKAAVLEVAAAKKEISGARATRKTTEVKSSPSKETNKKNVKTETATKATKKRGSERRRSGKLTIAAALNDNVNREERGRSFAAVKRAREKERLKHSEALKSQEKILREVIIPETITVHELASRMAERATNVIKVLMKMGVMATINQTIDADTAELVLTETRHPFKRVFESDIEDKLKGEEDTKESLKPRSPVVTVMGHVDHGKTSLLDSLRTTDVVSGEAGGITQHIGAYKVKLPSGDEVTFIDTPGHEAFTAMRARGAEVTDIVVLVVAANDGIMPQTVEAIRHAKAAGVPIVIAINKIDLPNADANRVRTELLSHEIVVEEMGGDVLAVEISAKERINLDKLVEAILLQAEMLDITANPNRTAEGVIVEARMEKGRGSVATVLIKRGTLKVGDIFVSGKEWGRVRAMLDDHNKRIKEALPSAPVEIIGLQGTPSAGDDLVVVESESKAREVAAYRDRKQREALQAKAVRGTLEQMFANIKAGKAENLNVVIKGDVQGSVEAIIGSLDKIHTDDVKINILHSAVGGINESDVTLAGASNALIIGFNVRANPQARQLSRRDNVDIRYYSIIYDVVDDMKKSLEGLLAPELKEKIIGYAEIRQTFNITKVGRIAGCMVTEGIVRRGAKVRLLRDDVVIHDGELSQLKRFKDDAKEVREGFECGMSFEQYNDIQVKDFIECYEIEEIAVHL